MRKLSTTRGCTRLSAAILCCLMIAPLVIAQHAPPRLVFHARYWNAIPGWEPRDRDAAYIEFTPSGNIDQDVQQILESDLKNVDPKWRMLGTNAVKHMDEILEGLIDQHGFGIAFLGYDIEYRPQTPEEEQQDPVAACRQIRGLADKYGVPLLVVPTANVTEDWGEKLAPFVHMFQPQGKAYQAYATSLAIYRQRNAYARLKQANGDIVIYHDMAMVPRGKELPLEDLLDYYYGCSDLAAANSIWAMPPHLPMLTRYVLTVRPPDSPPQGVNSPTIESPASVSRSQALVGEELEFTVAADDADGDTLTYTWDFGDHQAWADECVLVRGQIAKHTYLRPGDFTARVTVTDGRGGVALSAVEVRVTVDPPFAVRPAGEAEGSVHRAPRNSPPDSTR